MMRGRTLKSKLAGGTALLAVVAALGLGSPAFAGNDLPFRSAFPFLAPSQQPRVPGTIDDNTRN